MREPARYLFLLLLIALAGCQTPKEVLVDLDRHVPRAPRLHEVLSDDPGELRQVVDLNTRKGAWQRYLLLSPKAPKAAAILFAGGGGEIEISSAGGIRRYGNFLIRSRHEFVANGIAIAITDVPSDKNSLHGLNRYSAWHLKDIEGVVADFGKRVGLPVWLIGTSRGALSAAYGGAYSRVLLAGIVLTASMTEVTDVPFEKIGKGLVVHHRNDECHVTPPHYAKTIAARLGAKPVYFEGGLPPISSACQARAAHGFLGIEPAVVRRISDFIKTN